MADESAATFRRMLEERYQQLLQSLDQWVADIGNAASHENLKPRATEFLKYADAIADSLAQSDRPTWLEQLRSDARTFLRHSNGQTSRQFLLNLLKLRHKMAPIDAGKTFPRFAFDRAFQELKISHNLTELFDRLVGEITEIIEKGDIDSVTALEGLNKIAAALRDNRDASFFSMDAARRGAKFIWHVIEGTVKEFKAAKILAEAAEKAFQDTDAEFEKATKELEGKIIKQMIADWSKVKKLPSYRAAVQNIPGPVDPDILDADFEKVDTPKLPLPSSPGPACTGSPQPASTDGKG